MGKGAKHTIGDGQAVHLGNMPITTKNIIQGKPHSIQHFRQIKINIAKWNIPKLQSTQYSRGCARTINIISV